MSHRNNLRGTGAFKPPEGRKRIEFLMDKQANTPGKVIEAAFGVKP